MPTYDYKCPACGSHFERYLPLADYKAPQQCSCGALAEKQLAAPAVRADYAGYTCPITGKWVEGRRAHQENLKAHGCRVLEPGEHEGMLKRKASQEAAFEEAVGETAAAFVDNLPSAKREQLGREIESGLDISVERL